MSLPAHQSRRPPARFKTVVAVLKYLGVSYRTGKGVGGGKRFWLSNAGELEWIYNDARTAYRKAAKQAHTDAGGNHQSMATLNTAWALLDRKFKEHCPSLGKPRMGVKRLAAVAWLVSMAVSSAATLVAPALDWLAVSNTCAAAASGDVVLLPAGAAVWGASLAITNKNLRLVGAGAGATVIIDDIPKTSPETPVVKFVTADSPDLAGVSSVTFQPGPRNLLETFNGRVRVMGTGKRTRIDHCAFGVPGAPYSGVPVGYDGFVHGVLDHCVFTVNHTHPVIVNHGDWQPYNGARPANGLPYTHGHGSWADAPYWGSDRFVFVESNVMTDILLPNNPAAIDLFLGARIVVRHNIGTNIFLIAHGTEGQGRGARLMEDYRNRYVAWPDPAPLPQIRGGSIRTHANEFVNVTDGYDLLAYRFFRRSRHWGAASGVNPYDDNPVAPVVTGTHTGGMDSQVLEDSTAAWTTGQWAGPNQTHAVLNLTKYQDLPPEDQPQSYATANTATTLTFSTRSDLRFDHGDRYTIRPVAHSKDQPGQGQDNGVANGLPALPAVWQDAVTEPCYSWDQPFELEGLEPGITAGRDYTNGVAPLGYVTFTFPHPLVAPPGQPSSPVPTNNAKAVPPSGTTLSWAAPGAITFDVFMGRSNPPSDRVLSRYPATATPTGPLARGATYYWRVVASNPDGSATNTWSFKTSGKPADLQRTRRGPFHW